MQENSVTKFCMSACIFMILISLSLNFVIGLGVFGTGMPAPGTNQTNSIIENIASGDVIALMLSGTVVTAGLLLVVMYAGRTGSWNVVGAYLFGVVFWGSWVANTALFNYGGYLDIYPALSSMMLMITIVMVFIFAGATIGILGGND